ncbi:Zn-dependent hydrolase [Pseudooceanicola sediminis]|uniref:Zn-dependent hydrolase n=1 Tax=Pseudooceanicola sediminis TaxID=2211117 RepID=A0A399J651_9RHOB|nr:MBL fold metallo-hydrolase [Pseudooceanicola sediminis]KAA2311522.1 MBL fold metallo-hydrolase [Puniceibacterium sp. HSS470]RII40037.1 Zn-dependent hydrolase [Pseudooceanicola sediminis]|tara:strand:+ start:105329 stop:106153 length:825 start_codon:yes stop_codon:yes gene_type:complete
MIRILLALAVLHVPALALAQGRPSHCIAIAQTAPGLSYVHQASFRDPLPDYTVRISYLTHSAFLLQTPAGVSAVTDFPGFIGTADFLPDVVTMNHAHSSHWTRAPDPAIPHVLRGWSDTFGQPADHHLELGDLLVRNVPTDIRSALGGREDNGNSIFIFEVEGLCIGHLGHLHHEPNDAQYAAIGRLDVLMVPVDGGMTLDTPTMVRVVERLKSSIVLPMHWFNGSSLNWFLEETSDSFAIERRDTNELMISLRSLPSRPTIIVLQPRTLRDPG